MPSPTMERGLLGHFLCGTDMPVVCQRASTLPVHSPTYLSLQPILAAGARGRGARGGTRGSKSPRNGGGGGRGAGGGNRDRRGEN